MTNTRVFASNGRINQKIWTNPHANILFDACSTSQQSPKSAMPRPTSPMRILSGSSTNPNYSFISGTSSNMNASVTKKYASTESISHLFADIFSM